MTAVAVGDIELVLRYLAPDVVCVSDGGAAKRAARRPVVGADRVVALPGQPDPPLCRPPLRPPGIGERRRRVRWCPSTERSTW